MTSKKYPAPLAPKSLTILKVSQLKDIIRDNNIVLPTEKTGLTNTNINLILVKRGERKGN